MICKACAKHLNMQVIGSPVATRCSWCGLLRTEVYERTLAQQIDPRRALKDRITEIRARQDELREAVQEYHELCLERASLTERHDKLERVLTRVPVQVYTVHEVNEERFAKERSRDNTKALSKLLKTMDKEAVKKLMADLAREEDSND